MRRKRRDDPTTDPKTLDLSWQEKANCRGMDVRLFFPEDRDPPAESVRKVCDICPVRERCLQFALDNDEHGVWGALTERERFNALRKRHKAHCPWCKSLNVLAAKYDSTETCLMCGLSWRV